MPQAVGGARARSWAFDPGGTPTYANTTPALSDPNALTAAVGTEYACKPLIEGPQIPQPLLERPTAATTRITCLALGGVSACQRGSSRILHPGRVGPVHPSLLVQGGPTSADMAPTTCAVGPFQKAARPIAQVVRLGWQHPLAGTQPGVWRSGTWHNTVVGSVVIVPSWGGEWPAAARSLEPLT